MDEAAPQAALAGAKGAELGALSFGWGDAYEIGFDDELGYWARRRDNIGGRITAPGPDDLWQAICEDYTLKPVPRDYSAPLADS
jgi:hypothetical protein